MKPALVVENSVGDQHMKMHVELQRTQPCPGQPPRAFRRRPFSYKPSMPDPTAETTAETTAESTAESTADRGAHAAMKPLVFVPIAPPPEAERVERGAVFAAANGRRTRHSLPSSLSSPSPLGFRTRISLSTNEAKLLLTLAAREPPTAFLPPSPVREQRLFEETALSTLIARQSTNFRGWRTVVVGGADAARAAALLRRMGTGPVPVLDGASHVHLVWSRPYRTPFTMLLTFVGHKPVRSLLGVPWRALNKRFGHVDDIPTIGFLQQLHLGVLAEAFDRAAVIASRGRARAQVHLAPLTPTTRDGAVALAELEQLSGLTAADKRAGWRLGLAAQIGDVSAAVELDEATSQRLGAALLALRSERVQPGVGVDDSAPAPYQHRQTMDVSDALTDQCGRALYHAFALFSGLSRTAARELLLIERVDVLTPEGKTRLRAIRSQLEAISDRLIAGLPLWADLLLGRALSKNAARGKKAFALAGQRIYIGGLSQPEVQRHGLSFDHAVRAFGAAAARAAFVAEVSGTTDIPPGCDLLGGVCLMAGPVNQNDVGKSFFGYRDLLADAFAGRDPTSLLVWTLKAKTVADPIGNEEQLLNAARKGMLVDLRPGPHEVVFVKTDAGLQALRQRDGRTNQERAFYAAGNFVVDPSGREIPGNRGTPWPKAWSNAVVFGGVPS